MASDDLGFTGRAGELLERRLREGGYLYPDAAPEGAPPEVRRAVERFRSLPVEQRAELPLLYWLLGTGTPPYKVSQEDAEYESPSTKAGRSCGNCEYLYWKPAASKWICSQIRGAVDPAGWCNLWHPAENFEG